MKLYNCITFILSVVHFLFVYNYCSDIVASGSSHKEEKKITENKSSIDSNEITDAKALDLTLKFQSLIQESIKKNLDSVVEIHTHVKNNNDNEFMEGDLYQKFFFFFKDPSKGGKNKKSPIKVMQSTGFFINPEGIILTSYGNVKDALKIFILYKSEKIEAEIIGKDHFTNIALLKTIKKSFKDFKNISLPSKAEKIEQGIFCIAITNPINSNFLEEDKKDSKIIYPSLTSAFLGIISHDINSHSKILNQIDGYAFLKDLIQTDLIINKESEGSPLFNLNGEFLGMNLNLIESQTTISFAIAHYIIEDIVHQLLVQKKLRRSFIGIYLEPLNDEIRMHLKIEKNLGILVSQVIKDKPADKVGIKSGDILLSINSEQIKSVSFFMHKIILAKENEKFNLEILRNSEILNFIVEPELIDKEDTKYFQVEIPENTPDKNSKNKKNENKDTKNNKNQL